MLPEDKISEAEINDLVTSGELRPDWGATLKDKLKKSQQSANPLRQTQVTWATNEIKKAQANGLFGDKDSVESQMEMTNTLEAMHTWLDQNPGKNPTDYTKELLKPMATKNIIKSIFSSTESPDKEEVLKRAEEMKGKKSTTMTKETTKVLNGKTYIKQNGKWYEK